MSLILTVDYLLLYISKIMPGSKFKGKETVTPNLKTTTDTRLLYNSVL